MSDRLEEAWLDGELDEAGQERMEGWLREDDANIDALVQAAVMQEELRAAYRRSSSAARPHPFGRRGWLLSIVGSAAALAMAVGLCFPGVSLPNDPTGGTPPDEQVVTKKRPDPDTPRLDPTDEPVSETKGGVKVIKGALEVVTKREAPDGATVVKARSGPGTLRWGEGSLELKKGTEVALSTHLRPPERAPTPDYVDRHVVKLKSGGIHIKLAMRPFPGPPTEVHWEGTRIVAKSGEFAVAVRFRPIGKCAMVTVKYGKVQVHTKRGVRELERGKTHVIEPERPSSGKK